MAFHQYVSSCGCHNLHDVERRHHRSDIGGDLFFLASSVHCTWTGNINTGYFSFSSPILSMDIWKKSKIGTFAVEVTTPEI
jgi:hypothetical protein